MSCDEGGVAEIVRAAMHALDYDEVHTDAMGNVVGLIGPKDAPVRLLFDGHMDVVPATGPWQRQPFSGDVADGRVHGRGSTDMKGPLAAAVCGVAQAARRRPLGCRVAVSASVMEEVIEGAALGAVLDTHAPEMVVICEPSDLKVMTAQRGCVEVLVHVRGIPAHAAFPDRGVNAIELAARATNALSELEMPTDPVLGQMCLVPTDIVSTPYPSISALPSRVTLRYDRRTGTGETSAQAVSRIAEVLAGIDPDAFSVEISQSQYETYTGLSLEFARDLPAWHTPENADLVVAAQNCLKRQGLPTTPGIYEFCTNGSEAAGRRGLPTIGLGPGLEQDAHIVDEAIAIGALHQAESLYADLTLEIAG